MELVQFKSSEAVMEVITSTEESEHASEGGGNDEDNNGLRRPILAG